TAIWRRWDSTPRRLSAIISNSSFSALIRCPSLMISFSVRSTSDIVPSYPRLKKAVYEPPARAVIVVTGERSTCAQRRPLCFLRERSEAEGDDADCEVSFPLVGAIRSPPPNCPCAGGLPGSSPYLFGWRRKRSAPQVANALRRRAANKRSPIRTCPRLR